ncbi:MAG: hypothetical protein ACR2NP_00815 [Pirellulaceae bacterium]
MQIQCPCGQKYKIRDELAGQYIRCRKCGQQVLVQAAEPVEAAPVVEAATWPEPVADPEPSSPAYAHATPAQSAGETPATFPGLSQRPVVHRPDPGPRPAAKRFAADFKSVNEGIQYVYMGTLIGILAGICMVIFRALMLLLPALACVLGLIIGTLIALVGYFKCLGVPEQTGARPLITGTVVANLLTLIISFSVGIVTLATPRGADPVGVQVLEIISNLLGVVTISLFLLFIKKVAEYVDNKSAAHEAWTLMVFYLGVIGAGISFVFSMFLLGAILPGVLLIIYAITFALGLLGAMIVWLVKYLTFLNSLEFRSSTRRKKSRY